MNRTTVEIKHTKNCHNFYAVCIIGQTKFVFTFTYFSEESLTSLIDIFDKDYNIKTTNEGNSRLWSFQVKLNNFFGPGKVFIRLLNESQGFSALPC